MFINIEAGASNYAFVPKQGLGNETEVLRGLGKEREVLPHRNRI